MQFIRILLFHGLSDSLYTYSVTSYCVSGASWFDLHKGLWTTLFSSCPLEYDDIFPYSLFNLFFFSYYYLGYRCLTYSCFCLLNSAWPPNITFPGRYKTAGYNASDFLSKALLLCLLLRSLLSSPCLCK